MSRTARGISVLVACAATAVACSGETPDAAPRAASSSAPSASAPSEPGAAGTSSGSPAATPSATPSAGDAGGVDPDGPLEVPSPTSPDGALPGLTPPADPGTPLVERPLPSAATRGGGLVPGYPAAVLPPATGSTVEVSSVSPSGRRLQVSLTARSSLHPGEVLSFYRGQLSALRLQETATPAVAGSRAIGFRRGASTVTVTVTPVAGGTSYSLFSVLYAG